MCRALALTDQQLQCVMAAAVVRPAWRDRFLRAVDDPLQPLDTVADDDVRQAVNTALARMGPPP
jgi:hypothetical protein